MMGYFAFLSFYNSCPVNSVERSISKAILDNVDNLLDFHVSDLSMLSNTSEPSVKRFWKGLGYSSFQHMKNQIFTSYREFTFIYKSQTNLHFRSEGVLHAYPEIMSGAIIDSINSLVNTFGFSEIDRFVEHLRNDTDELLICSSVQLSSLLLLQATLSTSGMFVSAPLFFAEQRKYLEKAGAKSTVLLCGSAWHINTMFGELLDPIRARGASTAICVDDRNLPISESADFNLSFDVMNTPPDYLFSFIIESLVVRYTSASQ
ncbi:MAG: hypothetical protein LBL49_02975 [Clostridiales Family XIII bacterium]|jgi:DNA-binding MurR/RpiR family transcriptional regulator|nr:hypothetical protein [Clostridiales Family XIII bacterium]